MIEKQNNVLLNKLDTNESGEPEGLDEGNGSWGDYPLDDLLIRSENRTIHDVIRRIDQEIFIMDPDFQRDFIWTETKQSKLVESVIMRIPLPVFYMAENEDGRMIVVDGLQRLSTFHRFIKGKLALRLPDRLELDGKRFDDLSPKILNRVEDCNLTFYIIDSKVPERARLDIFDRVNSGVPLSRQQMRNSLFNGAGTRFLKDASNTSEFLYATDGSLNIKSMRDREFVNRFCAFQLQGMQKYRGDMDHFLAECLRQMNKMSEIELSNLLTQFKRSMVNNFQIFGVHSFRKYRANQKRRSVLNASLWDTMSTGLSRYDESRIKSSAKVLRNRIYQLLKDEEFNDAITYGTNDVIKVKTRFTMIRGVLREILDDCTD